MKLLCTVPATTGKVAAIKAVRGLTKMDLKSSKNFVEQAMENGSAIYEGIEYYHSVEHINNLAGAGFTLLTEDAELVRALNNALDIATRLRKYDTIRTLVDTIQTLDSQLVSSSTTPFAN